MFDLLLKNGKIVTAERTLIFGLYPQKGTIEVGSDADMIIVDMDLEREVPSVTCLSLIKSGKITAA